MNTEIEILKAQVKLLEAALKDQMSLNVNAHTALTGMKEELDELRGNFKKLTASLTASLEDAANAWSSMAGDIDKNTNDLSYLAVFTYYLAVNVDEKDILKGDIARITLEDAEKANVNIKFSHADIFTHLKS